MTTGEADLPSELLLAAALSFAPLAFGTTEGWSRAILAGFVSAMCLLRYRRFGSAALLARPLPPLAWTTAALLLLALIQALNPVSPPALALARGAFTASRARTFEWVFDWTLYASLLLFVPGLFRSKESGARLAWLLLVCGALVAVIGIAQQQGGNESYYGLRKVSPFRVPFGPFPNKNHAGTYLALCALAGAGLIGGLMEQFRSLWRDGKQEEFVGRLAILVSLELLILLGLFRANSRGASFACAGAGAAAGLLYVLGPRRMERARAFGFFLGVAVLLAGAARYAGVRWGAYIPNVGENSVTFRYAMAADGVKIVERFPWTGIGLGALEAAYPLWMDPVMKGFWTDHLHCDPLELAAEAGLPLAAAYYLSFVATLGLTARPGRPHSAPPAPLTLGLAAAGGAFLTHQVLEFPSQIMSLHFTALTCVSAAWGLSLGPPLPAAPDAPVPGRGFSAACAAAVLLAVLIPRIVSAYFDLLASRYPQPSKQYYQVKAAAWEPTLSRRIGLARTYWQLAVDNPPARLLLLRKAVGHSAAALELDPLQADLRRLHAGILANLGRRSDARGSMPRP